MCEVCRWAKDLDMEKLMLLMTEQQTLSGAGGIHDPIGKTKIFVSNPFKLKYCPKCGRRLKNVYKR